MSFILTSLPPLQHTSPSQLSDNLPDIHPLFFVPPLEDKPQNPIVDALVEASLSAEFVEHFQSVVDFEEHVEVEKKEEEELDVWNVNTEQRRKNQNLSWDALRSTFPTHPTSTPFLSEQSNDTFDAARHHVRPRLDDPTLRLRYILPNELLDLLLTNMLGNSSPLYIWDVDTERFVSNATREGMREVVIIQGLDDVVSESVIKRFLNIGTLMRRLDMLVTSMRRINGTSTTHAFSHALHTLLEHVRRTLIRKPPHPATRLTSLWLHYADAEDMLSALATLCFCTEDSTPPYQNLPEPAAALLSHIYSHLQRHIEHRSPRPITASIAYVLTTASRDYFAEMGESLGIYESSRPPWLRTAAPSKRMHRSDFQLEEEIPRSAEASVDDDEEDEGVPPWFFPRELVEALPAARKSLRILQAAAPDHPLCHTIATAACEWVWSHAEVERLWTNLENRDTGDTPDEPHVQPAPTSVSATSPREYKPELSQFQTFDLEPGAHIASPSPSHPHSAFDAFLRDFPARLSPLTPTLGHLTTVILQPLLTRTVLLSSSLLRLYLTRLHFETHLSLLRSYLLLTRPSFKTRLVGALFSDSDSFRPVGRGTRARTRARLGMLDARDIADAEDDPGSVQGIGLGHGLAERDTWPPGGADLSFFLRTVIVDSLERGNGSEGESESDAEEAESVWKEAEIRLGFALRDLPVGSGRERWLNPMSIEALDFLYLDYKPPHPLEIIITPDVLSKYQRIFTFLLRLLRAETVARIAFRVSFMASGPIFEYAPDVQKRLLRLRFQMQTFITSLVTYVFDSAIGGNFDAYMRRISKLREDVSGDISATDGIGIMDVFALGESHSELVDRILSGCLLRTAQRPAGDALRDLLEIILQFGRLIIDARQGRVQEAHAAEELRELDESFHIRMISFFMSVQMLRTKVQVDQNIHIIQWHLDYMQGESRDHMKASYLDDFLVRMDPTGWWKQKIEK